MGLSVGLDIAVTALRAQQLAVDVASHNIANANTAGFSRQEVGMTAVVAVAGSTMTRDLRNDSTGLGVDAGTVRRLRDEFIDAQFRTVIQSQSGFEAEARALEQTEVIINEPSESGVGALFASFWNAWRDLSNGPESSAARANLVAESGTLVAALRDTYDQLRRLQRGLDTQLPALVSTLNSLASEVADLNREIMKTSNAGQNSADLLDRRDRSVEEISRLVDVTVTVAASGAVNVSLGGRDLVAGARANALTVQAEPSNLGYKSVRWQSDGTAVSIAAGEISGLLRARDGSVATSNTDLNTLVAEVITRVNAVHAAGFGLDNSTGLAFFTGTNASDIAVNPIVAGDLTKVAAASGLNLAGDASNALAMADLQRTLTMNAGSSTFEDFYGTAVANLGVRVREVGNAAQTQAFLRDHLITLRDAVSGVSLDEEMTNLIKFQRAFEAAAQLISVVDSMLNTLINRMGLVGR